MDPEAPPQRLYGNGPPFDGERPDYFPNQNQVTAVYWTTDTDPRSADPPKRLIIENASMPDSEILKSMKVLVTYDGIVCLDTPEKDEQSDVYHQNLVAAYLNASDLGRINRTLDNGSLPAGYTDKRLIESHRWTIPEEGEGESGPKAHQSVRNLVDRHQNGVRHRLVWQNMKLIQSEGWFTKKRQQRAKEWGKWFGRAGFDIIGMCEIFKKKLLKKIDQAYDDRYIDTGRAYGEKSLQDLGVLVGQRAPDEGRIHRRLTNAKSKEFSESGPGFAEVNNEGWQLSVIEVPDLPGNPKFELFLTHLQGVAKGPGADTNEDKKQRTKIKQMQEVRDVIKERIDDEEYGKRPKILMVDFNIHAKKRGPQFDGRYPRKGAYFSNLMLEMESIGMQEAWLTHGGPAPSYESDKCNPESNGYTCDPFEPPEDMSVDEYYRQDRLDYVFIEESREEHSMQLDLSRVKMVSFDQGSFSDHNGITFELLTSPAG